VELRRESGRRPRRAGRLGRLRGACLLALLPGAAAPLGAEPVAIQHDAVSCVVAGRYPQIDACFDPADRLARARVYFRGDEAGDWYYVDMKPEGACFRGTLPRPRRSLQHVDYYVEATDREFAESRTAEFRPAVVKAEVDCHGLVAPFVSSATVVVGALSGAAVPAGFVGGGLLGLGVSTAAAVASVAGAGAVAGAVIAGSGGEETTTTTAPPRPRPTPSPTPGPPPTPVPTPAPTPAPGACAPDDSGPPEVTILAPAKNAAVGAVVTISAEVTDPGPVSSGVDEVVMSADEQGGSRTEAIAIFRDGGPRYDATWMLPPCVGPQDRWYVDVRATDRCGHAGAARIRVRRTPESCGVPGARGRTDASVVWTSELDVPDGRGQVVVDGAQAFFAGPGRVEIVLPRGPARTRVEAVLVSGRGAGPWRFTLAAGSLRPGSVRVVAGDVAAIGPDSVSFRMAGRPGERAVFTYEPAEPSP
jgi:hypothetical protein